LDKQVDFIHRDPFSQDRLEIQSWYESRFARIFDEKRSGQVSSRNEMSDQVKLQLSNKRLDSWERKGSMRGEQNRERNYGVV
jgi:hypothetical protein